MEIELLVSTPNILNIYYLLTQTCKLCLTMYRMESTILKERLLKLQLPIIRLIIIIRKIIKTSTVFWMVHCTILVWSSSWWRFISIYSAVSLHILNRKIEISLG